MRERALGGDSPRVLGPPSVHQGVYERGGYGANGEGGRREKTRSYIIHLGHSVVKDARKASGTYSRSMRDGDLLRRGCRSRRRGIYLSIRRVPPPS